MLTAGHCSEGKDAWDWYTCFTENSNGICNHLLGGVSSGGVYFQDPPADNDFETISTSTGGYVWDNGTASSAWGINGYITVMAGDGLTADGSVTQAVTDNNVVNAGPSFCFTENTDVGENTVCNAFELSNTQMECQPGDSGGPVLQRESNGAYAYAAGIINAGAIFNPPNYDCYGEMISHIRTEANVKLEWYNS